MFALLYLVSHIDRGNLGNAKIEGMPKSLNLVGNQYNIASTIFFVPYILFGVWPLQVGGLRHKLTIRRDSVEHGLEKDAAKSMAVHPHAGMGRCHDMYGRGPELCWLNRLPNRSWYRRGGLLPW